MNIIKSFTFYFFKLFLLIYRKVSQPRGVLLVAADIPETNLGDQALTLGALHELLRTNEKVVLVYAGKENLPKDLVPSSGDLTSRTDLSPFFYTHQSFIEKLKLYYLAIKVKKVFLIGADVIDGTYSEKESLTKIALLTELAQLGIDCKLISFSISKDITIRIRDSLKKAGGKINVRPRDLVSADRLNGICETETCADVAFLMPPSKSEEPSPLMTEFLKWSSEYKTVSLCLKQDEAERISSQTLQVLIENLASSGLGIVLLPHHPKDLKGLRSLYKRAPSSLQNNLFLPVAMPKAPEVKFITANSLHTITSRMHVAIASLGSSTPITCIPYKGKFEGLLKHFNLGVESITSIDSVTEDPSAFAELIKTRIKNYTQESDDLNDILPKVINLSEASLR